MFELTSQERTALIVISLLIAGGAAARQLAARGAMVSELQYSAQADDTLSPATGRSLRSTVEKEIAEQERRSAPLGEHERIDPNVADAVQIDRLPGVGPALADRIVAHRETNGRFRNLADLSAVAGIGPAILARIAPKLTLADRPPTAGNPAAGARIDLNRATEAELESLPGIGPAIAARIVQYRSENGPFREWTELEEVSGIGPRLRERLQSAARIGS
jgi:competence ComEA-like helix-hairpin-helix protein